jgi:hypothetical protein
VLSILSTIHHTTKGSKNYGIGARIGALPSNQAGITFASRTARGDGLVMLHKARGAYGIKEWSVTSVGDDGERYEETAEVIRPQHGELSRVAKTGTAVILHGDGKSSTWDASTSYKVHNFLASRYYEFPTKVTVRVEHPAHGTRPVWPFGEFLAEHAQKDGTIDSKNICGLNGFMFWWILPEQSEIKSQVTGRNKLGGGIGLVVDNEIFDFNRSYMGDFGLLYRSVQSRVVVLIWADEAEMDTARASVVFPRKTKERKTTPWKELGRHFAEHMPPEIDELLSKVTVKSSALDSKLARLLDQDWMKKLNPVKVAVPAKTGDPLVGSDVRGQALPKGGDPRRRRRRRRWRDPETQASRGSKRGGRRQQVSHFKG